jgi:hypothetical protein
MYMQASSSIQQLLVWVGDVKSVAQSGAYTCCPFSCMLEVWNLTCAHAASCRYRLLLRSSDQQFFVDNFIKSYLPTRYSLSTQLDGPANSASNYHEAAAAAGGSTAAAAASQARSQQQHQQQQQQGAQGVPLSNETWWRLYCAGDVLAHYLASAMQQGLNLQVCRMRRGFVDQLPLVVSCNSRQSMPGRKVQLQLSRGEVELLSRQ